ncbi:hypothetical protein HanRHA438_Chr11g0524531 [Helianthus annuus]|nr:hypothetical protein HanRHA438_Chr11g0524531 [Helianthus annuus]
MKYLYKNVFELIRIRRHAMAAPAVVAVGSQPQPWVPMQYPPAAMVMQHPMMAPGHYPMAPYMPYHPHHLPHPAATRGAFF